MALTVRRAVARVVIATAATLAVIAVVSRCEQGAGSRTIEVELDLELVPGVRSARMELRRGTTVVARAERRYDSGLTDPLRLRAPALGKDGEVRVQLETEAGLRLVREPLVAPGGSAVTVRVGE